MIENLENTIQVCMKCSDCKEIKDYITYNKPKSYYGCDNPDIMILGHSPKVRTSRATTVLKMNEKGKPLHKYITDKILSPLNITEDRVYCTNLIKCETTKMPEEIKGTNFFAHCFANCKKLFEKEVFELKPKLIISLSETVLELISEKYMDEKLKMENSNGELLKIRINGTEISYLPVIHIPYINSKTEKRYLVSQTKKLMNLKGIF